MPSSTRGSVALVTLGCTRNEVDSEELAGRLASQGWTLVEDAADADVAVVNTCGFVEQAKKDSIDTLLEAADLKATGRTRAVVAVGCLAERYGQTLADELPDADAVLGFDSYRDMSTHLRAVLDGEKVVSHVPSDRRRLLPLTPVERAEAAAGVALPGHGDGESFVRARLDARPWAPLKIASGCDRRCSFCAIPMFRGSFVSRRPTDVVAEARWLAGQGVRELFLASENSTSYGKDLGDLTLLEKLLPELGAIEGIDRVRVSYLQPAEVRPGLLEAMAATPGVMPWYDLSFQHAAPALLRRMRRFGGTDAFLELVGRVRSREPLAGIRSNVIVGFPGETEEDVAELERFLTEARLDVVGVFGYSDEDGTEAEHLDGHLPEDVVAERVERLTALVEELTAERAQERVGERVVVLVEEHDEDEPDVAVGRAEHQGPDVDGVCLLRAAPGGTLPTVGSLVEGVVTGSLGVDLVVEAR
ncbi:30S ribosomal protein S12 methylthiotransferase RimO [Oryzobacter sp. R7]|uniref:30S ribosomal protein S12 methylthiotransferase RimO n=1 Tax=Oryzobacter faecalis TaxID=3388656 RepID=UPI00398CBB34